MSEDKTVLTKDFAASFKGFMDTVVAQAPKQEPIFLKRLA